MSRIVRFLQQRRVAKPRNVDRRGLSRRLKLEALEERRMLATFTVMNDAASGTGSLHDAILEANVTAGHDVIEFDAAFFAVPRTIQLSAVADPSTATHLVINDDITITGPGRDLLTIEAFDPTPDSTPADGNFSGSQDEDGHRLFRFESMGIDVSLSGMTLTGGSVSRNMGGGGGAIYSFGNNVTLDGLRIHDNNAWTDTGNFAAGGGAYLAGGGDNTITIANTIIENNVGGQRLLSSGSGAGGGLYIRMASNDIVTISGSQIINNSSGQFGGRALSSKRPI